jgi:hypothetical protein
VIVIEVERLARPRFSTSISPLWIRSELALALPPVSTPRPSSSLPALSSKVTMATRAAVSDEVFSPEVGVFSVVYGWLPSKP